MRRATTGVRGLRARRSLGTCNKPGMDHPGRLLMADPIHQADKYPKAGF